MKSISAIFGQFIREYPREMKQDGTERTQYCLTHITTRIKLMPGIIQDAQNLIMIHWWVVVLENNTKEDNDKINQQASVPQAEVSDDLKSLWKQTENEIATKMGTLLRFLFQTCDKRFFFHETNSWKKEKMEVLRPQRKHSKTSSKCLENGTSYLLI